MKKVLITGKDSYIGTSVENWLMKEPDNYKIDTIDMKDGSWRNKDFSKYDVVIHVAGIVHNKETKVNQSLYYKVNRDLAFETAQKAKEFGVGQFVLLSTMSVYGLETGIIKKNTSLRPKNAYGKSKLEAENLISDLKDNEFKVAIIRPPMIYGKNCKGNYSKLVKLVLRTPIFPKISNKRSMIYIDNLSVFIKQLVDNRREGVFFPQNAEYVNISEMVELISEAYGKKIIMTELFNPLIRLLNIGTLNKVFGDLTYEMSMSKSENKYMVFSFKESINMTEE